MIHPLYDLKGSFDSNRRSGPPREWLEVPTVEVKKPRFTFLEGRTGVKLVGPLGVGSGPWIDERWTELLFRLGYGVVTGRSHRTRKTTVFREPNCRFLEFPGRLSPDRLREYGIAFDETQQSVDQIDTPVSLCNSFGIPSPTREQTIHEIRKHIAISREFDNRLFIASIAGTPEFAGSDVRQDLLVHDYQEAAKLIVESAADAVEVNLSSPNIDNTAWREGTRISENPKLVASILRVVRETMGERTAVLAKIGYVSSDFLLEQLLDVIASSGADAVVAMNSLPLPVVTAEGGPAFTQGAGRLFCGVSGSVLKDLGISFVGRIARLKAKNRLADLSIVALGGVMGPDDVQEYLALGADYVETVTAAMFKPGLAAHVQGCKAP